MNTILLDCVFFFIGMLAVLLFYFFHTLKKIELNTNFLYSYYKNNMSEINAKMDVYTEELIKRRKKEEENEEITPFNPVEEMNKYRKNLEEDSKL